MQENNTSSQLLICKNTARAWDLNEFFRGVPENVMQTLELAHGRYEHLIDITCGVFSNDEVEEDRRSYPEFIKTHDGKPFFSDDDCVSFMSQLYSLPKLLCRMYITNDFNWTIKSGFVDGELNELLSQTEQDLVEFFRDEDINHVNNFFKSRSQNVNL